MGRFRQATGEHILLWPQIRHSTHAETADLVGSVSSNRTGRCVFRCTTRADAVERVHRFLVQTFRIPG